jgi:hypothetical protein
MGNLLVGNTVLGNTVTYTGNMITVNNSLANVIFSGNTSGNLSGNIQYVQTQTTDSVTQANITIPLNYQIPAIHIFSNVAKSFGTRIGPTATGNVDFWAYSYNQTSVIDNGVRRYDYGLPSTSNVALSTFRTTSTYRYAPLSIRVQVPNGIASRTMTRSDGAAGYFSFWINFNKIHADNRPLGVVIKTGNGGSYPLQGGTGLYLIPYNGQLYWSVNGTVWNGSNLTTRIELGAHPAVGVWTQYSLQITPGATFVVSAWRNGVPLTGFYQDSSTLQTGSTWAGRSSFSRIEGWQWGAPYPSQYNIGQDPDFYVDDIQVRTDAPYTDLQSFTPQPVVWGGNVTQMVTGI